MTNVTSIKQKSCACCGKNIPFIHDMAANVPDALKKNPSLQSEFQGTEDVMVWNRSDGKRIFFLRGVAKIPVQDHPKEYFGLGLWLEVKEEDARAYASTWKNPEAIGEATWNGSIANSIKGYPETIGIAAKAHYSSQSKTRPLIFFEEEMHPLTSEQKGGLSLDRILELYKTYGVDSLQ